MSMLLLLNRSVAPILTIHDAKKTFSTEISSKKAKQSHGGKIGTIPKPELLKGIVINVNYAYALYHGPHDTRTPNMFLNQNRLMLHCLKKMQLTKESKEMRPLFPPYSNHLI